MTSSLPRAPQIVLCFDGTGNTLRADGRESNILRIFRMLDRTDDQDRTLNHCNKALKGLPLT
jgi:uncharacterized protein (DUF2235 family)